MFSDSYSQMILACKYKTCISTLITMEQNPKVYV